MRFVILSINIRNGAVQLVLEHVFVNAGSREFNPGCWKQLIRRSRLTYVDHTGALPAPPMGAHCSFADLFAAN
jgi:hypothetical protein